jgi:hypothetical protein
MAKIARVVNASWNPELIEYLRMSLGTYYH